MKKFTLKTSRFILYALLATAYTSQATPEHDHLTDIVNAAHDHFRHYAIPWSNRFLYSSDKLSPLVDEFNRHLRSFEDQVVRRLYTSSAPDKGELTSRAQNIMQDLHGMIITMKNELSNLLGCTSSFTFAAKMKQAQTSMNTRLATVEHKMRDFKHVCDKHSAQRLRSSVINLERIIFDFKNSNNNMTSTLMKRIPILIS